MRIEKRIRELLLGVILLGIYGGAGFAYNNVEIDFSNPKVKIADFSFGGGQLKGDFSFSLQHREDKSLVFDIEGENVSFKGRDFPWVKAVIVKKEDLFVIEKLEASNFSIAGSVHLTKKDISLKITIDSLEEASPYLQGIVKGTIKIWGKMDNFLASGEIIVEDGKYLGKSFSLLTLNFLGKPPMFNLTDSLCRLADGNVYKIEGVFNLANFKNLFPMAEFISQKVTLGGWELMFEDKKNRGIKKDVSEKFGVIFNTYDEENNFLGQGAELRYQLEPGQFLRFRMQEDSTIVGFEKRKEF